MFLEKFNRKWFYVVIFRIVCIVDLVIVFEVIVYIENFMVDVKREVILDISFRKYLGYD